MTHNAHTPGPWVIYGRDIDNNTVEICQSGIKNIAKRLKIAEVLPQPHYDDNQEANARLMASAPELLGVLKYIEQMLDDEGGKRQGILYSDTLGPNDDDTTILQCLRHIIAKAEGKV